MSRAAALLVVATPVVATLGCATGGATTEGEEASTTRTSVAYVGTGGAEASPVIEVEAGTVRVLHSVPSTARLRATVLEGLDPANRHLRYEWDRDGTFPVAVAGRYRHSVLGSIVGRGMDRLTSRLTYPPLSEGG